MRRVPAGKPQPGQLVAGRVRLVQLGQESLNLSGQLLPSVVAMSVPSGTKMCSWGSVRPARTLVGGTGIEPVTSSVSGMIGRRRAVADWRSTCNLAAAFIAW